VELKGKHFGVRQGSRLKLQVWDSVTQKKHYGTNLWEAEL